MANEFKIEIPIETKGKTSSGNSSGGSNYEKQLLKQQQGSTSMLSGILKATAVVAAIWVALSPILTPLLKLLSLLALVVFLPLLPYMKDIAKKIGETITAVKEGQKNGDTPMEGFTGGLGALFGDWGGIGTLIAAGFLLSLGGGAAVAGVLFAGLSFVLAWETFKNADSSSLEEKLKGSLGAGLAAGITALAFGAVGYALPIGVLTFALTFGLSFLKSAVNEEDTKKAIMEMAAGSLLLGAVAGGVVALLGLGLGAAGLTTVAVGAIIFEFTTGLRAGKQKDKKRTLWEMLGFVKPVSLQFEEDTSAASKVWQTFMGVLKSQTIGSKSAINNLGFMIGSRTKGSYPIVYSLLQAENEWVNMSNISNESINGIIKNLDKIPRKIVTIHEIRTVRRNA